MPVYEFDCPDCGIISEDRPFAKSGDPCVCEVCGKEAPRVFGNFVFVEDRLRFMRNPRTGENFSDTLGQAFPQDRKERAAIYASKGIEPVSPSEMPSQWKTALEYNEHRRTGGDKLPPKEEAKLIEPPDLSGIKSVAQQLKESNLNIGI
jgi:putative FmdB family regulatory protein